LLIRKKALAFANSWSNRTVPLTSIARLASFGTTIRDLYNPAPAMLIKPTLALLSALILPLTFQPVSPHSAPNPPFSILFGSGFAQDTVSLVLNEVSVLQHVVLQTDSVSGISKQVSINCLGDTLYLLDSSRSIRARQHFSHTRTLSLALSVNRRSTTLLAKVDRGKILLLTKWPTDPRMRLSQFKKPIQLY
jgi:hypothetical protein